MSVLDRKYMLRLDLSKQKNNTEMEFSISDNQTSDFSVKITHKGKPVDLTDVLGLLVVTKPSGKVDIAQGQIIETSSVYFNLQNNCKDEVGIYSAYVVLGHTYQDIIDDKDRVLLGQITYVVNNDTVQELQPLIPGDDNFQIMIDIITRLQELESNENARILAEQLRVQAEQARVAEHNSMIETFDTKVQEVESTIASVVATEQGIKEAEAIRVTSENTRINNETDRQHAETDRVVAEKKRVVEHDSMMDSTTVAIANINSTDASIKEAESKRVLAEQDRVDAENIREQAIEKVKTDIVKLINDTNKKIDDYKLEKDTAIQQDLEEYKSTTTQDIQDYKVSKDTEINKSLSDYKTSTTQDVEDYKNTKNAEIDKYKSDKDLEIDNYISSKNAELDKYVTTKNTEIDNYKNSKDTLINNKLEEVDTAEQSRVEAEQQRVTEHADREAFLNSFESQLGQIETKNVEQDNRLGKVEYTNKRQDVMLNGLFNENADGRLTIEGEGNNIKLEGSKDGVIEVKKAVGNTLVNLWEETKLDLTNQATLVNHKIKITTTDNVYSNFFNGNKSIFKPNTEYTFIVNISKNTLNEADSIFITSCSGVNSLTRDIFTPTGNGGFIIKGQRTGVFIRKLTTIEDFSLADYSVRSFISNDSKTPGCEVELSITILEGDYTNKPIPAEYFEGMQSTFEDKIVTQEMVDAGEESVENLGKYKADIKVVGKNLANKLIAYDSHGGSVGDTVIKPSTDNDRKGYLFEAFENKQYHFSKDVSDTRFRVFFFTENPIKNPSTVSIGGVYSDNFNTFTAVSPKGTRWGYLVATGSYSSKPFSWCQIEEGTQATQYEEYKESKQTLYLDEPLYKGNEMCIHEGKLGYWKNREKVVLGGSEDENIEIVSNWSTLADIAAFPSTITPNIGYVDKNKNYLISDKVVTSSYNTFVKYNQGVDKLAVQESPAVGNRLLWSLPKGVYTTNTFKSKLKANPTTVIYELAEPIFVPILENTPQWILDSYNSCTVHFETNVPILSSSFKYTGGIPSVMVMDRSISDLMYSFAYISKALNILGGEEV